MIFARLEKLSNYVSATDFEKIRLFLDRISPSMEDGRYDIEGERIFAKVMSYDTKEVSDCKIEAHNMYIDIQATLKGSEGIDVFERDSVTEIVPYDDSEDVAFYSEGNSGPIAHCVNVPGYFTMLYPSDAHRPQEKTGLDTNVKKFVIKICIDEFNMQYGENYFNLIFSGLNRTITTDSTGRTMNINDGIARWAEKADKISDYAHGLMCFCGNGASASMAEHMSHDWFQNAHVNTLTCSEVSHITAISNDIGYDDVYSYRVQRVISDNDILVGISSSGNSQNIVNAVLAAKEKGAFVITITGKKSDNNLRKLGDVNFYVPLSTYGEVESAHAVLLHMALDYYLDKYLGGRH